MVETTTTREVTVTAHEVDVRTVDDSVGSIDLLALSNIIETDLSASPKKQRDEKEMLRILQEADCDHDGKYASRAFATALFAPLHSNTPARAPGASLAPVLAERA